MAEINVLVTEEKLFISLMINLCDKFSDVLEVSDILFDQSLENAHNAYPEATLNISIRERHHVNQVTTVC